MVQVNRQTINEWSGVQVENITFASDIKALGIRESRGALYRSLLNKHDKNLFKMFRYQHRRNFLASLINILLYIVAIGIFAWRVIEGQQRPSDIYVLAIYLGIISNATSRLAQVWSKTANVNDALGETLDILDQEDAVQDPPFPVPMENLRSISLRNVSFNYDSKKDEALSNVTFNIKAGQTIALVGRSGSGKSTIIKLLLRFYDPNKGDVLINNMSLKEYAQDEVRTRIGVVMQDVALFNDTIAGNIAIALPGVAQAEIEQAAKLAHAHEFITALPDGYETLVGERGVKLSGGEKQRVSIARAVLRNPELVLLDEATSALDSESEKAVQAGLRELLKDRTAIIIAHRLSTITHADQVIVLDQGKIIQHGTYQELKANKGLFADLLKYQEL